VALWEEVTAQTVSTLVDQSIWSFFFLALQSIAESTDVPLDLGGVRKQVIVDPVAQDRRLHRHDPRLWQSIHPAVQLAPGRPELAF
jgi:hypothetical protein